MKPTASQRIAESVGVAVNYKPEPNWLLAIHSVRDFSTNTP
jgi:hypothetical protein